MVIVDQSDASGDLRVLILQAVLNDLGSHGVSDGQGAVIIALFRNHPVVLVHQFRID